MLNNWRDRSPLRKCFNFIAHIREVLISMPTSQWEDMGPPNSNRVGDLGHFLWLDWTSKEDRPIHVQHKCDKL